MIGEGSERKQPPAYVDFMLLTAATISFLAAHFRIGDPSVFWVGVAFNIGAIANVLKRT
jgi:hypothetical protein